MFVFKESVRIEEYLLVSRTAQPFSSEMMLPNLGRKLLVGEDREGRKEGQLLRL